MARSLLLFFLCLGLAGCAGQSTPGIRLALDGPPLHVAMQGDTTTWTGSMDRGCMAGVGSFSVHSENGLICRGQIDHPANDKGRLHAELACADGSVMVLVFRNLGPDQGMGLGRINPDSEAGEQTTFFYHPSQEEARRRLVEVRTDIAVARESKHKKAEP